MVVSQSPGAQAELAAFAASLHSLASAWDRRDARAAADVFTDTAIYSEQSFRRTFQGRRELERHFARAFVDDGWMRLVWHHISFDAGTRIGAGEFSFYWPAGQVHGMVSVRMEHGRIANWREYAIVTDLDWVEFQDINRF
jgi:hypothetical protein